MATNPASRGALRALSLTMTAALLSASLALPAAVADTPLPAVPDLCEQGLNLPACQGLAIVGGWKCGDIVIPIGSPGPYDPTDCEPLNMLLPSFVVEPSGEDLPAPIIPVLVALAVLCGEVNASYSSSSGWSVSVGWDCFGD